MKKLITFKDSWPWILILVLANAVTAAAFVYNWHDPETHAKLYITGLVDLVFCYIIGYRYDLRWHFVTLWNRSYHTKTNVAIIPTDFGVKALNTLCSVGYIPDIYQAIDDKIDECVEYWADWNSRNQIYPPRDIQIAKDRQEILDSLNGATISISDQPITVKFIGKVMGYQEGQQIGVVFDGEKVKTLDQLLNLVAHEVSHLCLSALGQLPEFHHKIFEQTKFC